ncbi:unnamed protein product [Trichobilharzia szidati]|nr:unnamed protein product [Trichobilharzia szidati]
MFSFFFLTVSAKPPASTNSKHLGKSKTPEIASVELVLSVREWNETAITRNSEESLKILDKYCQDEHVDLSVNAAVYTLQTRDAVTTSASEENGSEVEKQVSKLYPGLKETIEKCSLNKATKSIQLKLSHEKLLEKGYLSSRNVLFWRFLFGVTEVQLADVNSEVLIAEIELSVKPLVIGDYNKSDRRFLAILDNLCKDVKEVVKRTEPRLSSIPLSCDIPQLDPNQLNTHSNIIVLLAMPHSEMQQVFPSEEWFDSLQSSFESASILESDKWITDIISFEEPSNLVKGETPANTSSFKRLSHYYY